MVSNNSSTNCQTTESKWDIAICDAQSELREAEKRVGRLRTAIRIFKENKDKGVPWPGDEK